MKLIAMKDRVVILSGEARASLYHPVDGRETRNDKYVIMRYMLNDTEHGASFAGLRECDSQNTENSRVQKYVSDFLPEF